MAASDAWSAGTWPPTGFQLERPTVEDIILFLVKGAKEA